MSTVSVTEDLPVRAQRDIVHLKLQVTEYGSEPQPSAILSVNPSSIPTLIVSCADCDVGMLSVVGFNAIVNSVACEIVTVTTFDTDGAFSASPL